MPLAALAMVPLRGSPGVHAAVGGLLVAAGSAALAFLPTSSVAWTIPPQLAVGAGLGLALPALAGRLLPERNGRDAARLLSISHVGIALVLLILAPIAQSELDSTLAETRERGAAIILDAPIDPRVKLDIAPKLSESVETEDPRGGLERGVRRRARRGRRRRAGGLRRAHRARRRGARRRGQRRVLDRVPRRRRARAARCADTPADRARLQPCRSQACNRGRSGLRRGAGRRRLRARCRQRRAPSRS